MSSNSGSVTQHGEIVTSKKDLYMAAGLFGGCAMAASIFIGVVSYKAATAEAQAETEAAVHSPTPALNRYSGLRDRAALVAMQDSNKSESAQTKPTPSKPTAKAPAPQPAAGAAQPKELKPGLYAQFFHFPKGIADFPRIDGGRRPDLVRVDRKVEFKDSGANVASSKWKEHVYVQWSGVIRVPKDGEYTFFLNSNDGSRLYVNNDRVVDNGGPHGMKEVHGKVKLKKGEHPIRLEYFQSGGTAGCILSWSQPGQNKQVVSSEQLFHRPGDEIARR